MVKTPATDLILATASTKHAFNVDKFQEAMSLLESGLESGKIWNMEFQSAKYWVAEAAEHAQHISARKAHERHSDGSVKRYVGNDPRNDIGYAFSMNQAAKLSRRLKKLPIEQITPEIQNYIDTLDQIIGIFEWLKQFKTIIVKGRKVVEKTKEQILEELFNTGICAICESRQKLTSEEKMVMHGYQMSEYNHAGYRMGKCFGVGYKPYELSNEANIAYEPVLESQRTSLSNLVETLKSGTVVSLRVKKSKWDSSQRKMVDFDVTYTKEGTPFEFAQEMENKIYAVEGQLRTVKDYIKVNNIKIERWKAQPLKYGTKVTSA